MSKKNVKINFVKGSIFETEKYKLDAIIVFIPCGLTALRMNCYRFVKLFGEPIEENGDFILYQNNSGNKVIDSLKYVLINKNNSNTIYKFLDVSDMVFYSLNKLSRLGVKNIGMNGIRTDDYQQERIIVDEVKVWINGSRHGFKEIHFIDLRDGFNKNK